MQFKEAEQVVSLVVQLKQLQILNQKYNLAQIPTKVINACQYLITNDSSFRKDFWNLLNRLSDKYIKIKNDDLENNF